MNQETDDSIKKGSQDRPSIESGREEFNKELLDLLKKIDIDQKDPLVINQLFIEITKKSVSVKPKRSLKLQYW